MKVEENFRQDVMESATSHVGFVFFFISLLLGCGVGLGFYLNYYGTIVSWAAGIFVFSLTVYVTFHDFSIDKVSGFLVHKNPDMTAEEIRCGNIKASIGCIGLIIFPTIGYSIESTSNLIIILTTLSIGLISEMHLSEMERRGKRLVGDNFSDIVIGILTILFVVSGIDSSIAGTLKGYIVFTAFNVAAGFTGSTILFYIIKRIEKIKS
ncbi:hypothetical protein ACE414_12555 [Alteromonas macleodii]|uniref:hypothetical protein n=1 Tax=Alteromonas macleodii TaxID=28108 RepID=UPI0036468002